MIFALWFQEIQQECEELRRTEKLLRKNIDDLARMVHPVPNPNGVKKNEENFDEKRKRNETLFDF